MTNQGTIICTEVPRAEQIARLNDQLRKTGTGGTIMITQGVQRITGFDAEVLAAELANYGDFSHENDPHGERDLGLFSYKGWDIIWKIDYFDKELIYGSEDPANPEVTHRVLTVMLASEW